MSDIFRAVNQRGAEEEGPKVDALALDPIKLFPLPAEGQQAELASVAARLLDYKPENRGLVVSFAACTRQEGASFVSYNVARTLALSLGRRTAWVDVNFQNPQSTLQARQSVSFVDCLNDAGQVASLGSGDALVGVPGGQALPARRAEMASSKLEEALAGFSSRFDFTILDCPPVFNAMETALIGTEADGLVLVVEATRLKHEVVNHALDELRERRVNVLGTVLNKRRFELPRFIYNRL